MEKNKKYVVISDFNIRSNNRGTAALGYGAISFMLEKGYIDESFEIIRYRYYNNPLVKTPKPTTQILDINGKEWKLHTIYVCHLEEKLYKYRIPFIRTSFTRTIRDVRLVAAINGGDGLTDIYGEKLFNSRLPEMEMAAYLGIPFVVLPQTIGPFLEESNKKRVVSILRKAERVYVRDTAFIHELEKNGLSYEKTNDLSYYMKPIPFPIEIKKPCIGINVSGLAYSNNFGKLKGQFESYPKLATEIVKCFQAKGLYVYIIPHAYNVNKPETDNDDMVACRDFYNSLSNNENVIFVDKDLISPQIKYLISRMDFFMGTRMHANFAAIFTGTPVYGLSYSYKFKGAFENNGIFNRLSEINNLQEQDIPAVVSAIEKAYFEDVKK